MTQHTDLIERLRASSEDGLTPDDAYAAAEALEAQAREIAELKAQESELCTLYGLAQAECQKLRAELERTANNRDMWKSQCERQADELRKLRKDAERLDFIETAPEGCVRMDANSFCPSYIYWGKGDYYKEVTRNDTGSFCGPTLRAVLDAAMPQKGQP
ncbi:MAG: hypothetical protein WAP57_11760 [Aquabacterium commune]|uniref:hypothetical protein n=1 Tax=Aquabacterium commune TaxID=70586 RepID=UPI003BAFF2FA